MEPKTDAQREALGLSRKKASPHATRRLRRPLMAPRADIVVNWLWVIVPAATAIFISYLFIN